MKYLIVSILFIFEARAVSLGQYISSPDGSSVQTFSINKGQGTFEKKSNFFDKKKDYSLGVFSTETNLSSEEKEIQSALTTIQTADDFLKQKKLDFNELSLKKPHESFLFVDNYRIAQSSELYPGLKKVFDSLAEKNWKHVSGVRLSADLKVLATIKNGKQTAREPFNFQFHCKGDEPPTVCSFKDDGILFVEKK